MAVTEIFGNYAQGTTSKLEPATLALYKDGSIEVTATNTSACLFLAHIDKIVVNSRLGNTPRVLQLAGDIRFITPDNDGIDQYLEALGKGPGLIHTLESNLGMVVFSIILTVVLVGGYLASGLPYTARLVADNLPDSVSQSFGTGSLEVFDKLWTEPSELSNSKQEELRSVFESYLNLSSTLNARVVFRSGIGPNAFALPDGTIVFTDELVELADSDEELIAILLHEIGHLEHKHLLRRTIQGSMLTIIVVLVVGDLESANLILGLPTILLEFSYSRDFELEADRYALGQLKANGIRVDYFSDIMTKLQSFYLAAESVDDAVEQVAVANVDAESSEQKNQVPTQKSDDTGRLESALKPVLNYFSTHPATLERVQLVEEYR